MNCLRYLQKGQKFFCPFCFLLLTLLLGSGCTLPEAPGNLSWLVHANIPLSVRTYGLWDLADTQDEIRQEGSGVEMPADSSLFFSAYADFDEITLADSLYFESLFYTVERPILAIKIPVNSEADHSLSLGRLNSEIAATHGTTQNLLPHSLAANILLTVGFDIDSFEVDSGNIGLRIENSLPYAISNLHLSLSSGLGSRDLLNIPALNSGEVFIQSVELTNMWLRESATLNLEATGEGGNGIFVDSTRSIEISTLIDTLEASPFYGRIPRQVLSSDSLFELDQEHFLFTATVDSGIAIISLNNQTQFNDTVVVTFPNVVTANGDTLSIHRVLIAGQSVDSVVNLAGCRVRLMNTLPQLIEARLHSVTLETDAHRAFVAGTEIIQGSLRTERIYFSRFDGEVNQLETDIPEENIEIDTPPDGWETVHPTDVQLYFHVHEFISAYTDVNLTLQSFDGNHLIATEHILMNNVFLGEDSTIVVNNLASLIQEYPDRIHVKGRVSVDGAISYDSSIPFHLDIELKAPLSFTLDETHPDGDVERVETDNLQDIEGGSITVKIWNRLPVGGSVFLVASADSSAVLPNSGEDADTLVSATIPTGTLINGRATEEAYAEYTIALTDSILRLFHLPYFYARPDILIHSSNHDTLTAHGTDYVKIQVIADILHQLEIEN